MVGLAPSRFPLLAPLGMLGQEPAARQAAGRPPADHRLHLRRPQGRLRLQPGPRRGRGGRRRRCPASRSSRRRWSPRPSAVQKTMESMIKLDGATLLFPTSFGYFDPHILKEASKYPNVKFLHCGGLYDGGQAPQERRQLLRLHRRGPVRLRHRRRPDHQVEQAGLHRRQADPAGAAQHQRLHAGRPLGRTRRSPPA